MSANDRYLPDFDLLSSTPKAVDYYDNLTDPRSLIAHFLMVEIGLKLSNIVEFSEIADKIQRGNLRKWTWNGNLFCVEMDQTSCAVTDFEAEPDEDIINSVLLSHAEFLNVLREWRAYVAKLNLSTY